jgi:hypothetical protein
MTNNNITIYGREDGGGLVEMLLVDGTDVLNVGDTGNELNLQGSETRPTYNGVDLALLSDV